MAKQTINVGTSPNDGTGTPLRTAFQYTNSNFTELYTAVGPSGNNIVVPGSATITGDLTVDTNTLFVNSTNDRVGLGTTTPGSRLDVRFATNPTIDNAVPNNALRVFTSVSQAVDVGGQIGIGGLYDATNFQSFANISGKKENSTSGNNAGYFVVGTCRSNGVMLERYRIDSEGISTWSVGGSTAMTLNSTGLGVGGSPQAKIHGIGTGVIGLFTQGAAPGAALSAVTIQAPVASGFTSNPVLNFWFQNTGISNPANECFAIRTSSADRLYIDSAGNVGVGVTPSANRFQVAGNVGLPNSCTASGETSGVFSIDVANLLALTGGNWRQASILLVYSGVNTDLSNPTVLQTVVTLTGLSTWNTIAKNDIVGTASVAISNDTTTGARITVTVPVGNSGTVYAVLLGGAGSTTRPSMTINA